MRPPFLALWRPDPIGDGARFDRVVLVLELLPAEAPHSPHVLDAVRVRIWRQSCGAFAPGTAVLRSGDLRVPLVEDDPRFRLARAVLEAEGVEVTS